MNIYSSPEFLEAFNKAYFPDIKLHLEDFLLQKKIWRLPTLPSGEPITKWQFIDFFEPVSPAQVKSWDVKKVNHITRVCDGIVTVQEWFEQNLFIPYTASPLIQWSKFKTWDSFWHHLKQKDAKLCRDSERRKRKLENDIGSVNFRWQDTRPEAFDFCIKFKSLQFRESHQLFQNIKNLQFFQELAKSGLLVVSSLSVNDQLIAVDFGAIWNHRFYSWISAYDQQYSVYAPGRLLMHMTMASSYQQGHKEFDFLLGGEAYKWNYATHSRLITELGGVGSYLKSSVKKQPLYIYGVKQIKQIKRELRNIPERKKLSIKPSK